MQPVGRSILAWATLCLAISDRGHGGEVPVPGWAFKPLSHPSVQSGGNPIDHFIKAEGRDPDKRALIRRVTFDLTGLPPTPEETAAFLADTNVDAYEKVVDRLLTSPRSGERWARLWMDAAHFAETHGHDQDRIRENAWPYRDYLIRSFNDDKPYGQFVQEQVAGDALFPDDPQAVVALGFLAAGPWDESSLRDIREDTLDRQIARYLDRDDMLTTALQTFCSVTIQCARCHDHKFDPILQKDYYALQAVFAGVDRANRPYDADPSVAKRRRDLEAKAAAGNSDGWLTLKPSEWKAESGSVYKENQDLSLLAGGARPERETTSVTLTLPAGTIALRVETLADDSLAHKGPGRQENGNFHLSEFVLTRDGQAAPIVGAVADFNQDGWDINKAIDGNEKTAWGIYPEVGKGHWCVFLFREPLPAGTVIASLKQLHGGGHLIGRMRFSACQEKLPPELELVRLPAQSHVYAAAHHFAPDGGLVPSKTPRAVHLLTRGEITKPQDEAQPGALSAVPVSFPARDFSREENRRASLAEWLTQPEHPLTWRSIVNRVWHWHFGKGLVETPNDFGNMGSKPRNPELLDWLANWFRDDARGSLKKLHRLIVTSAAYRRDFAPQRLDAEAVRDAILQITGRLDLKMGGPSDRQFSLKPGVHVTPLIDYASFDLESDAGRRRSVYRFLFRTLPDPWMDALDCPAGDQLTADRKNSVTVQQALAMYNSAFIANHANHFAARLAALSPDVSLQIDRACELAFNRPPAAEEKAEYADYVHRHGLANFCRVLFNANEFIFVK